MAVQITGRQIANAAVDVNKLDLSSGTFDFQSAVLQVATPSADSHAATKGYVDALAQGLHWKDSVKVATTQGITLSGTQTIDGIAVSAGDRVLVKDQIDASSSQNGIYVVASGAWSRATDMDASDEFSGAAVFVQQGSSNADTGYVCTNDGAVTVGTTAITFTQFTGAGQFTAGDGLDLTGSTFSVNVDGSSIEINADSLRIKDGGVTTGKIAADAIDASKIADDAVRREHLNSDIIDPNGALAFNQNGSLIVGVDFSTIEVNGGNLQVKNNGITSGKLADGAVQTGKIQDSAVTGQKIAGDAIDASKIADDAVRREHLNSDIIDPNSALAFNQNGSLIVNGDASTIEVAGQALQVKNNGITSGKLADGAVTTAKIAGDAIDQSKIADGAVQKEHLNSNVVDPNGGLSLDPTNNNLKVTVDQSTIEVNGGALRLKDGGVSTAKIGNAQITTEKLKFGAFFSAYDANGSTNTFALSAAVDLDFVEMFVVTVNGLVMEYKATPDAQDNYKIDNGGAGGVGQIVFGSNLSNGDRVTVRGFIND